MKWDWFYTTWPFIGLGGALVMFPILLWTDTFRSSKAISRWRDVVWLGWLAFPLYLLHQFEEYSLPVLGLDYSIQEMVCKAQGYPPYPDCPIPLSFYPTVNIALMWAGAPLAAYLGRRNVAIGLSFWGMVFANGALHALAGIVLLTYNTGFWTGAILFVPLSAWVVYACVVRGPYSGKVMGVAFAAGIATHILLGGGYALLRFGVVGTPGLLLYSVALGFAPIFLAALMSRWLAPDSLRPSLNPAFA